MGGIENVSKIKRSIVTKIKAFLILLLSSKAGDNGVKRMGSKLCRLHYQQLALSVSIVRP